MNYEPTFFLDENGLGLSLTSHIRDHFLEFIKIKENPAIQKHVFLFDDIALLLFTKIKKRRLRNHVKVDQSADWWILFLFWKGFPVIRKSLDTYFMEIQQMLNLSIQMKKNI